MVAVPTSFAGPVLWIPDVSVLCVFVESDSRPHLCFLTSFFMRVRVPSGPITLRRQLSDGAPGTLRQQIQGLKMASVPLSQLCSRARLFFGRPPLLSPEHGLAFLHQFPCCLSSSGHPSKLEISASAPSCPFTTTSLVSLLFASV